VRPLDELKAALDAAQEQGDEARVEALLEELAEHDSAEAIACGHAHRAQRCLGRGDLPGAVPWLQRAQECLREAGRIAELRGVTSELGGVLFALERYGEALDAFTECRRLAEDHGDASGIGAAQSNLGIVFLRMSEYPLAQEYFHEALRHSEEAGNHTQIANIECNLGLTCLTMGEFDAATEHLERSLAKHEELGNTRIALGIRSNIGRALDQQGRGEESEALLRAALDESRRKDVPEPLPDILAALLECLMVRGRNEDLRALLDEYEEVLSARQGIAGETRRVRAHLLRSEGDLAGARAAYEALLEHAESRGRRGLALEAHYQLRELAKLTRDLDLYIRHDEAQQQLREEIVGAEAARRFTAQAKHREMERERAARAREREVLYGALPKDVADRLVRGEPVNDAHDRAAVLFLDLAGFTSMSGARSADEVVRLLASVFASCDAACRTHGLTKVKTIGDAYLAVALPAGEDDDTTARRAAHAALEMMASIPEHEGIRARIGLDLGPVVAGVVGTDRLQYDVWGDTVHTASRMETAAEPGRILVTERFAEALRPDLSGATLVERGEVEVKGKGAMRTYWLEATAAER